MWHTYVHCAKYQCLVNVALHMSEEGSVYIVYSSSLEPWSDMRLPYKPFDSWSHETPEVAEQKLMGQV